MPARTIRIVSIMEAQFVTGPAKNLLEFAARAREAPEGLPAVDLSIITYHRDEARHFKENPFIAAAEKAGVPVDVIHEKGRFDRSVVPQIAGVLESRQPDIVQTHNSKSHFLMRYSGLWRKYRWLAFHHGYTATDLKMKLYHELDRWSLRVPEHLVTVCGPFQQQLANRGVETKRITIQHNAIKPFTPVAPGEVEVLSRELKIPEKTPVLLMVGRLSHEKGHLDFLNALAELKRRGREFHAVLVGEGLERGAIENARNRLQIQSSVTLAGHQNNVRPFYGMASVFVMPSHSEGSPNALLEAMAAGVPIVASAVGGIPELVTNNETALLVPARNPIALADALERLLAHPSESQRLAEAAKSATARFSYESYHRALLAIYQRVLNAPRLSHRPAV